MELLRQQAQAGGAVKAPVAIVEQVRRRVIDIQQDRVELAAGGVGIESRPEGELEEIAMDEAAAGIGGESRSERNQPLLVPFDHRLQVIDDDQGPDTSVLQSRPSGVSEPQSADHDIQFLDTGKRPLRRCQTQP